MIIPLENLEAFSIVFCPWNSSQAQHCQLVKNEILICSRIVAKYKAVEM
jgi:hypothetical protein